MSNEQPVYAAPQATMPSPWLSIWLQPRETISEIVRNNPSYMVWVLTVLGGTGDLLRQAQLQDAAARMSWPLILLIALVVGAVAGVFHLLLDTVVFEWVGRQLRGTAPHDHIRAAIAWSNVPMIAGLALWAPRAMLHGADVFSSHIEHTTSTMFFASTVLSGLGSLLMLWSLVILVRGLQRVQGYESEWRALANIVLARVITFLPTAFIWQVIPVYGLP